MEVGGIRLPSAGSQVIWEFSAMNKQTGFGRGSFHAGNES